MRIDFTPRLFMNPQADLKAAQELAEVVEVLKDSFKSLGVIIKQEIGDNIKDADKFTKAYGKTLASDLTRSFNSLGKKSEELLKNQEALKNGQAKSKDILKQIEQIEQKRKNVSIDLKNALKAGVIDQQQYTNLLSESLQKHEETIEALKTQSEHAMRTENAMGNLGSIVKGLNKIPILGSLINSEKVLEKMQQTAAKTGSSLAVMGTGILELGKSIGKGFTDPLTVLTFFLNAGLKADKQTTELAKSLGIGKDQASGLRQNFVRYAAATGDAFITTDKLVEAQGELTNELGIAAQYSGKQTEDFTRLTKLMGLSANEAGKLARLSVVNGASIEDTTKSIIKGSAASQRSNKISVDQRTILKDVANLSAGILVKFQGNPEALGAAVVQARALGLNLEEVDKIGESLLNWESSIENELKAELITGKQLNLERARAAALTGDQAALMQEIGSQVGTLGEYQNMNVIAQKSLAEAFGLSRDEMSKMLIEQEKINKLGDVSQMTLDQQLEALKAQGEPLDSVLYKQIQQQSAQEKFNNAISKLQDLIGNLVAGPFGTFIDMLSNAASSGFALKAAIVAIGSLSLARTIGSLVTMASTLSASAVAGTTTASALTLGLGAVAIVAGVTAVISMMNSASDEASKRAQQVQDGIASSSKGPFTITDKFGATAITAAGDGIAVSPNINKGGGGDNTGLMSAINELRNAVNALANKPAPAMAIQVGAEKLGEVVGRQAETGTNQYKNAYRLA
jgi:hypothetical protein